MKLTAEQNSDLQTLASATIDCPADRMLTNEAALTAYVEL